MATSPVWSPRHPAYVALLTALSAATQPIYVVGGVVRDELLGKRSAPNDLDVVVEHSALHVARKVADALGWAYYPLDADRDVARLVFTAASPPLVCDIAAMRGGLIESDLLARDFTINAMAVQWQGRSALRLVDMVGGQADLQRRRLRQVTPASMAEDPVRLLRAVRFAVQLDFTLEEETLLQIMRLATTIRLVSAERLRDEMWKIMLTPEPARALEMLERFVLLRFIMPEVADMVEVAQSPPHVYDVHRHTLQTVTYAHQLVQWLNGKPVIDARPAAAQWQAALEPWRFKLRDHFLQPTAGERLRIGWLPWYALLHDIGKPVTRTLDVAAPDGPRYRFYEHDDVGADLAAARLDALRFSRQEIQLVDSVIRAHMRPHLLHASFGNRPISRRALFRFFRDIGGRQYDTLAGVDVIMLALADYQAIYGVEQPADWEGYLKHATQFLDYAFADHGLARVRQPLVDGHTIMRYFSLAPGRQVGDLLDRLQEAQAAGEIATADEALALAATWMLDEKD